MAPSSDFSLTAEELRAVARFALTSAEEVLGISEAADPDDPRPRAALDAAREFANGAPRGRLHRVTSADAHRAAREVSDEAAAHAARAAGDAAAAAYLHPLHQATQVGHILRASAHAARAAELAAGDPAVGEAAIGPGPRDTRPARGADALSHSPRGPQPGGTPDVDPGRRPPGRSRH
ncbi:putative immunity protein [Ornithinimicrobium murale]|uniref:putative immunity protein n=1 Tax=Ornithinimicrobium murale TaxID=1050153 RepID=UPI001EE0D6B4|nr:hypothetical protein [Ornithinimicrobium murale]